jgi:hypothetical protein
MKKKKKWKNYEIKIIFLFDNSYTQITTTPRKPVSIKVAVALSISSTLLYCPRRFFQIWRYKLNKVRQEPEEIGEQKKKNK